MQRTKILSDVVTTPTSAGLATSIGSATCVRLYNNNVGVVTVSISTSVGAGTTYQFTMPSTTVEFLEKLPTDVIYTSSQIQANKVAFTN